MSSPAPILGIDLGTTNSLVAVADPAPRILADEHGRPMLPSVVRFDEHARPISIGHEARTAALAHPRSTISSVKRLMGRTIDDARQDLAYLSYDVQAAPGTSAARIAVPSSTSTPTLISPQEVSAHILRALKARADAHVGTPASKAVIAVPAYFDDAQRQATREAGRLAGLDVVRIVNEPTAAALAYGLGLSPTAAAKPQTVAVYDLGGGTFDVSILRITKSQGSTDQGSDDPSTPSVLPSVFQVLSTAGDTHLGGDDFDAALIRLFTTEIHRQFGSGGTLDFPPETLQALRHFAESAKIRLSTQDAVTIRIDLGPSPAQQPRVYTRTITRAEFEQLVSPLVDRTLDACRRAMRDAQRELQGAGDAVSAVVLVGGATRTPLVRAKVAEFFNLEPYTALDPDQVVALGAAILAGVFSDADSSRAPSLLLDVVPLSLGVETVGGAMAKLIHRNATVPARASELFSTSVDHQTGIKLHILQGEREMAADCRSLARLELAGIPPMPAGIPKLRVTFHVDAGGVLTVAAVEERSGKRLSAQIVPNHGLTQAEVDRIERDSLTHARADMTQHRITDLIANSKLDLHWITRQLDRLGVAVPAELRAAIDDKRRTLQSFVDKAADDWRSVNADDFYKAKDALDKSSVPLHELAIAKSLRDEQ